MSKSVLIAETNKVFSEAIEIVADLYKDGLIQKKEGQPAYPDLLAFYDVDTKIEQILYEMFMDHRMKTYQGVFHLNSDYSTWYGYAKMKKDLVEIKDIAKKMRDEKIKIIQ